MEELRLLSVPLGVGLWVVVLLDVFRAVLHPDAEAPLGTMIQRGTWRAMAGLGRRMAARRRGLLALAGPLMTVLTFAVWMAAFILGLALIVWPFLSDFRFERELEALGFLDAVYYAGVTVTVLGYGDVTPLRGVFKVLTVVGSGFGFVLLTGIVTYIIEITSGIKDRNTFALRVHDESGGGSGVDLPLRLLAAGDVDRLVARYEGWAAYLRRVHDDLHRFTAATFYYRSRHPVYDPEPAFRRVGEAAIAGHLAAADHRLSRVGPAIESIDLGLVRLMWTVASQYLEEEVEREVRHPEPDAEARRLVADVAGRLGTAALDPPREHRAALLLARRLVVFLDGLDRLTSWRAMEAAPRPKEATR